MMKRLFTVLCIIIMVISLSACTNEEQAESSILVVKVGDEAVYMDEMLYRAYVKQASYEAYYIACNKELDWSADANGQTLESAVKNEVVSDVINELIVVKWADKYNIKVDEEAEADINDKVDRFFDESSSKLLEKINISKDRLYDIYKRDYIYEEVLAKMLEEEGKLPKEEEYTKMLIKVVAFSADNIDSKEPQKLAEEMTEKIADGENIKDIAEFYGLEVTEGNIGEGDRNGDDFENMCLSLAQEDCDWVEMDGTYYVIYCEKSEDEDASKIAYNDLIKDASDQIITKLYKKWVNGKNTIQIASEEWDKVTFNIPIFAETDLEE